MYYIIQFGSTKTPEIKKCLENCGQKTQTVDWKTHHKKPQGVKGVIFSGSPTMLSETDLAPYKEKISAVLEWNVPILGICFGHQLLGMLHGAKIYKGEEARENEKITVVEPNELLLDLNEQFDMMEDHTEGIELPENFIHIASSFQYPVEVMKHNQKPFYGVQFHPEVSGEDGMILFENFIHICKNYKA
ncbi:MAG: gamma-glutamyl-gamma-aminobutyrate hydrolase family protein [Bacteroidia bacterium]|nr:gamma-glutamyl-gamma-aminobutyrate hydrolase family protein [Bacteroidia bacterium]